MSRSLLSTGTPEDEALWRATANAMLDNGTVVARPEDPAWQELSSLIGEDKALTTADGSLRRITPDSILRDVWSSRVGPHAWIAASRAVVAPISVPITLRPGTATNTIAQILIVLRCGGQSLSVDIPVFPIYNQQWTLDLTFPVPVEARELGGEWRVHVNATDDAGRVQELDVYTAPDSHLGFYSYPTTPISDLTEYLLRLPAPEKR